MYFAFFLHIVAYWDASVMKSAVEIKWIILQRSLCQNVNNSLWVVEIILA